MKNEILDDIRVDGIHRHLKKGENVLWEGKPFYKFQFNIFRNDKSGEGVIGSIIAVLLVLFFGFILLSIFILLFIGIFISSIWQIKIIFVTLILILITKPIHRFSKRKRTKYLISNKNVIFQLANNLKKEYHSIPLEEIKDIVVTQEDENYGTIFLAVKNPQSVGFETYNLTSGDRRHQPTLEMIENVEEVADYIRKAIRKKM